jgi:protoheme IX farnesyltransferase
MSVSNEILAAMPIRRVEAAAPVAHLTVESVSRPTAATVTEVNTAAGRWRNFVTLVKPEITLMVTISAAVACLMASASFSLLTLIHTIVGTGLVAAGAAALNQYLERAWDGRMRRTATRPLPAGKVTARAALWFGVLMAAGGSVYVFVLINPLTSLLGLLTLFSYLFLYTPLKRRTRLCTLIGAIPGAAPILMGWAAAANDLPLASWGLFAVLFLWQFPHFYAIGWLYREDYARAGMLMVPGHDDDAGTTVFRQILVSTQLLILASLLLKFLIPTGDIYFVAAVILGLGFYFYAFRAYLYRSKPAARKLLHASVIYLPLLYLVLLLDKLLAFTATR